MIQFPSILFGPRLLIIAIVTDENIFVLIAHAHEFIEVPRLHSINPPTIRLQKQQHMTAFIYSDVP